MAASGSKLSAPQAFLRELHAAWPPGARLVDAGQRELHLRFWKIDAFDQDLLTVSRRSLVDGVREVVSLRVVDKSSLGVVDATCVGASAPVASRRIRGRGRLGLGSLEFTVDGERCPTGGSWGPFRLSGTLRLAQDLDLLAAGVLVRGTRTEPEAGKPATMRGRVVECGARVLVIEAEERWEVARGRFATPTYRWRFERDGVDEATGSPRWKVRDGVRVRGAGADRSNWRGYVVLQQGQLVGSYGFDWQGMEKLGNRPGTRELTHPLRLELLPDGPEVVR